MLGGHSWVLQLEYLLEGPVQSPSWHSRDSTKTPPPQVLEQSWSEIQSPHFPELSSVSVLYTKESTPTNKMNNKRQIECQNFSVCITQESCRLIHVGLIHDVKPKGQRSYTAL